MESKIRPGRLREKREELDCLLVVWDEMNKEQDIQFVKLGRKTLDMTIVRVIMFYCPILCHVIHHWADLTQTSMQTF